MSRTLLVPLVLLLGVSTAPAAEDEDAKLTAYFRAFLDEEFRERPLEATNLGDHRFDDNLDDVPPKPRAGWTERYRRTLDDLPKKVERGKLSRSSQIDYDIFKHHLTRNIWLDENSKPFEDDPRTY